ncbi:hypothetical protein GCM10007853_01110 [Algimonas ampicilliniresistens]|uniref:Uncharacterized protein n=1 Tax=Algimonas ampicilliniresistens TaxID=1298735 RepID=A0ABQ5V7J0_9PROT|nr:hypothetical protein [Algimonas ampicilliniresistens]GLQ22237.1 hypothetical protein GCM10007853_01110 [Algimonas ampicilliniresistens]
MSRDPQLPALSLSQHFAREVGALDLSDTDSPAQAVGAVRRVLDRTAAQYARAATDPALQRAGQWLIEIVKSGTGLIDRASHADIVWDEVATKPGFKVSLRPSLFYGGAGLLGAAGLLQGVGLAFWGAVGLAGLHAVSTLNLSRLPFWPKPKTIEDASGRTRRASAVVRLDQAGLVAQVTDALKTADHILLRLSTPTTEVHWRDDTRLTALLQGLLEAGRADDSTYALELARRELPTLIEGAGLQQVDYSKKTANWFDRLPVPGGSDGPDLQTAAPALVTDDGRVVRRGTVWVRSE